MIDLTKVQFASQYNIDKIVLLKTGSFDTASLPLVPDSTIIQKYTIPHTFGRPVFTDLLWDMGNGVLTGGSSQDGAGNIAIALSDKNNVYIYCQNIFGPIVGTLRFHLVGAWIDNYDDSTPAITPDIDTSGSLYFDSRANYEKIVVQDVTTVIPSFLTDTFVTHNLGYVPNYKVYFESLPGQVWPTIYGGVQDFWLYSLGDQNELVTKVSSTQLDLGLVGGVDSVPSKVWYRLYSD